MHRIKATVKKSTRQPSPWGDRRVLKCNIEAGGSVSGELTVEFVSSKSNADFDDLRDGDEFLIDAHI